MWEATTYTQNYIWIPRIKLAVQRFWNWNQPELLLHTPYFQATKHRTGGVKEEEEAINNLKKHYIN